MARGRPAIKVSRPSPDRGRAPDAVAPAPPVTVVTDAPADVPAGFKPLFRTSPFLEALGPFFYRPQGETFIVGLRVAEKHANARGTAHGGLLLTLADIALGYTAAFSQEPALALTTANISADFAGHARIGDWLEARVDIQRIGRRLVFANAYLLVGEERIVRFSAVFARNAGPLTVAEPRPDAERRSGDIRGTTEP
jgi:acyl-coenzyme A thioesterase 13